MESTRCLRQEHQVILRVLDCFEVALGQAADAGGVSQETFAPFVTFFREFADACHHCKEEDRLFPALERCGIPREGGPIGVMLYEHKVGRELVSAIDAHLEAADGGEAEAIQTVLGAGRQFIELLRAHIGKEDHCLFAMAENVVQGEELNALAKAYQDAESSDEYCERMERCRGIADTLTEKYGQPAVDWE